MSTHFTIKYIVSYYTDLLLTLYSYIYCSNLYFMQQKGILYHVSLPQYYDYCVPLYIYHYLLYLLFIVFILTFIKHDLVS